MGRDNIPLVWQQQRGGRTGWVWCLDVRNEEEWRVTPIKLLPWLELFVLIGSTGLGCGVGGGTTGGGEGTGVEGQRMGVVLDSLNMSCSQVAGQEGGLSNEMRGPPWHRGVARA